MSSGLQSRGGNHMSSRKKLAASFLLVVIVTATDCEAQGTVQVDAIQKQLSEFYQTAKATADGTDLVTAGSVLVLQKDNLLMDSVEQPFPSANNYTKGAISNAGSAIKGLRVLSAFVSHLPGAVPGAAQAGSASDAAGANATREFVAGEKFFVTKIDTRPDSVTFYFMSDPIKDVRYHSSLKFPFPKGTTPSPDDVAALVSEVVKVDDSSQDQRNASNQGGQQSAPAPPAEPKTIALGQTRDQVVAMFGVPSKIVQLGAKEIDIFPDMKVTFVQNKVVDVK
jgi:hypothetical protein